MTSTSREGALPTVTEQGRRRGERRILSSAFLLFVTITLWCAIHHEAWRDESDPWLLARDGSFTDMLVSASNRGVPLLFDFSVLPFARMGLPYFAMQLVNLVYVWLAVLLLFRSSAFPTAVKVLFAFSYFPAFEFSVIPRPYGLHMLLVFAAAALWRERYRHPLPLAIVIGLLANTTALGLLTGGLAGALLLCEWVRSRPAAWRPLVIATAVMLAGGLLAVAQLWPRRGGQSVYTLVSADTVWYALASTFFPDGRVETFLVPALIVVGLVTFGISRNFVPVLFLYGSGAGMMAVYLFIWMGGIRHAGLLLVLVVGSVWMAEAYGRYRGERLLMAALAVSLAYSILPAIHSWILETKYAFSGSREVATFLTDSGLSRDAVLVSHPMFWTSPLVYLPGASIWDPLEGRRRTYSSWQRSRYDLAKIPRERLLSMASKQFSGRRWVYLTVTEIPWSERSAYRLLFRTRATIWRIRDERFFVYEPL